MCAKCVRVVKIYNELWRT